VEVPGGDLLIEYAEAFYDAPESLSGIRDRIEQDIGTGAAVDAAAIVAIYDSVVKIADATGIPIEEQKAEMSEDIRETLGINEFPSAGGSAG